MPHKLTPYPEQEAVIADVLAEPTHAYLIGDQPGAGKTLIGCEIVLRGGFERVLFTGLKDTFAQWAERLSLQSDGAAVLRRVDATKAGRAAYADMMAGKPGFYFASWEYLMTQDWTAEPQWEDDAKTVPQWKRVKKDNLMAQPQVFEGDLILKDRPTRGRGVIGPAQEPTRVTKRKHLNTYRKHMKAPFDMVLCDESHKATNRKGNTYLTLLSIPTDWKIAMSGTWFGNSFENAWAMPYWLWKGCKQADGQPVVDTSFVRWRDMYVATEPVYGKNGRPLTTPRGGTITKVVGEKVPGAFVATLPGYIRRMNPEQAPDATIIECDPTPRQAAQQADLEADLLTWAMTWEKEEAPLVVDMPAVLYTRLGQVALAELSFEEDGSVGFASNAASAKLGPLKGIIDFWQSQHRQPVAIYTASKKFAKFLALRMQAAGYNARAWHGDLTAKERDEMKRAFLAGEFQYIICTIQSFGTGLDGFQTVCSKVIWTDEVAGNPSLNEQAIARFFRQGRTMAYGDFEHVKVHMRGSVDVKSHESLLAKAWAMRESMKVAA